MFPSSSSSFFFFHRSCQNATCNFHKTDIKIITQTSPPSMFPFGRYHVTPPPVFDEWLWVSLYFMGLMFPVVGGSDVHKNNHLINVQTWLLFNLNSYIFLLCLDAKVVKMTRSDKETEEIFLFSISPEVHQQQFTYRFLWPRLWFPPTSYEA